MIALLMGLSLAGCTVKIVAPGAGSGSSKEEMLRKIEADAEKAQREARERKRQEPESK